MPSMTSGSEWCIIIILKKANDKEVFDVMDGTVVDYGDMEDEPHVRILTFVY